MKKALFPILLLLSVAVAGVSNAQNVVALARNAQQPDAPGPNQTIQLKQLLNDLGRQFQVNILFEESTMPDIQVDRNALDTGRKLDRQLATLLKTYGLVYKKLGTSSYLIVPEKKKHSTSRLPMSNQERGNQESELPLSSLVMPPAQIIKGRVTNDASEGIPGVSVLLKGTTNGTATDSEGKYSLSLPDNQSNGTLVFSFIGYTTEELAIGNRTTIDVKLVPDIKSLSEVVVVGYGTQQKKEVTGATSSVTSKDINSIAVTGLDQALQGRASGVQVTQNSGEPGGSVSIRIRGVGSINSSNEPLYVVDGIPFTSLNSINPNDIERIDVLKDAASAAIYGSRASNGVVLVTTKRAKSGKIAVTLDAYAGVQSAAKKLALLNGPEFAKLANENLVSSGLTPNPLWSNPATVPNSDWQRAVFQNAPIQNYSVSVSGGGEKSRTLFSAGYFQQGGIVIGSNYQRFTARLNSDYDITDRLKVGITMNVTSEEKKTVGSQDDFSGVLNRATQQQPTQPITTNREGYYGLNPDGSINPNDSTLYGWEGYAFLSKYNDVHFNPGIGNVVHTNKNYVSNPRKTQQLLGSVFGEYEIIKGLKIRSTLNLTVGNSFTNNSLRRAPKALDLQAQYRSLSTYAEYSDNTDQWNWINTLSYAKTIGKHNFSVIVGSDALKNNYRFTNISTSDVPDAQQVINASDVKTRVVTGFPSAYSLISYIGRITYDLAGKYLLTANIRRDGSSKFGPNNKYGTFPSASVGWRVSEEAFMKNVPFLDELKLRASYGVVGNQNIPNYKYLSTYSNDGGTYQYTLAETGVPAFYSDNVGDPSIRWENSTQANIGVDLSLLRGQFTFTADYYVKKLSELLGNFPVPSYTGVFGSTILRNGFSMENKGLELALGYNQRLGAVNFSANANFSTVNNRITQLTDADKGYVAQNFAATGSLSATEAQTRTQVGERIGNFYGYVTDGIFQTKEEADQGGLGGVAAGDRRYKDLNGDGKINADDKQVIGNGLPKYIFGLTLKADFKGFDLSVLLNGQSGVQIANTSRFYLYNLHASNSLGLVNGSRDLLNSWHGPGTSNDLPRNTYDNPASNRLFSNAYIENGAFLRVRNMQLGYTLPSSLAGKIGMSQARIYVAVQNLHTFTKYTGYDPEVGSPNQSVLLTGVDFGRYPLARMWMGGINFQF